MSIKTTLYCLLAIAGMAVYSCENIPVLQASKESYLQGFEAFIANVQKQQASYGKNDWQTADERFTTFSKSEFDRFEHELTEQEKNKVDDLIGIYTSLKIKYQLRVVKQDASHLFNKINKTVKELRKP